MADNTLNNSLDGDSHNDAEKGAALGGLGGAAVGAAAGSLAGPLGTVIGAVAGGLIGAGASGAAVGAIDQVDNDNTVSGLGDETSRDVAVNENIRASSDGAVLSPEGTVGGHNIVTGEPSYTNAGTTGLAGGAVVGGLLGAAVGGPVGAVIGGTVGSLTGGVAGDAAEAADADATLDDASFNENNRAFEDYADNNATVYDTDRGAHNNYSGDAYRADVIDDPTTPRNPGAVTNPGLTDSSDVGVYTPDTASDDVLAPSSQTDYRSVDNGVTSIGSTDQNADVSTLSDLGTPGVRTSDDVSPEVGGTTRGNPDLVNDPAPSPNFDGGTTGTSNTGRSF